MKVSPCKQCEKRAFNCHSICSDYISWKLELDNIKQKKHQENEMYYYLTHHPGRVYRRKK